MGLCILGQGDCSSLNKTDISDITRNNVEINNSIKNKINQDCNATALQNNTINIIGSTVKKLTANQKNSLESMCILQSILKSTTDAKVVNDLMTKVKDNLKSSGGLLGSVAPNNETVIKNLTENSTKVDNSKFNEISKNCIMSIKQTNLLNIIGSTVEDTTTDQANAAFLKCLSQHSDDTGITADSLNVKKSDTETTKESKSGDIGDSAGNVFRGMGEGVGSALGGVFGGGNGTLYLIAIIISFICCSSVLMFFVLNT
jgi:hypothetical protein